MYINYIQYRLNRPSNINSSNHMLLNDIDYDKKHYSKNIVYDEWEIPKYDLFIFKDRLLGQSQFSKVYLAKWKETIVVAKVIKNLDNDKALLIKRELEIQTKMHHPKIVQFLGYTKDPFIIVLEYVPNKTLDKHYRKLTKKQKLIITRDLLEALTYIHNRKPSNLIHRDIKPNNILITKSFNAKISDFGLSRFFETYKYRSNENLLDINVCEDLTTHVGTKRYKAPEMINKFYNHKVDIYSLGLVLYELFENKRYSPENTINFFWTPKFIRIIIHQMLTIDPNRRPEALYILTNLIVKYPFLDKYINQ